VGARYHEESLEMIFDLEWHRTDWCVCCMGCGWTSGRVCHEHKGSFDVALLCGVAVGSGDSLPRSVCGLAGSVVLPCTILLVTRNAGIADVYKWRVNPQHARPVRL
jgi:hypothetical protein